MHGRTCIQGHRRQPKQFKRDSTTNNVKLLAAQHYADGKDMQQTIDHFFPGLTAAKTRAKARSVYRWSKRIAELKELCRTRVGNMSRARSLGGSTVLTSDSETEVVNWVNMLRKDGVPISTMMLQTKAMDVAEEQGVAEGLFTASPSWVKSFMRRHRLSIRARTRQGQTTSAEAAATFEAFAREVNELISKHPIADVFNCDQTGILFEYLPRTTVTKKEEKTVWVKSAGKDKERLTAMLLGDRAGNKYEPFIVLRTTKSKVPTTAKENSRLRHGFGRRLWKEIRQLQDKHSLQIYGNESAWWTGQLSIAFLDFHFGHRHWTEDPILLLWDDFSGHWTPEVVAKAKSLSIMLKRIPPSFTYVCQPADLSWNRPLKCSMRSRWVDFVKAGVRGGGKITPPSRKDVLSWFKEAWAGLTRATITSGFKKAGIHLGDTRDIQEQHVVEEDYEDLIAMLVSVGRIDTSVGEVDSDDEFDRCYEYEETV